MAIQVSDLISDGFVTFRANISRYSGDKYCIIIPVSLKYVAEALHGKEVLVAIKPRQ